MDRQFHPTLYRACNYLSILGLKLIHVLKRGHWCVTYHSLQLCLCLTVNTTRKIFKIIIVLTYWGRVTHICVSKLTIIGSDIGLSPGQRKAIIWTNDGILFIGPSGTNFIEILIDIFLLSFKTMPLKMSYWKGRPYCLGLNVLSVLRRM